MLDQWRKRQDEQGTKGMGHNKKVLIQSNMYSRGKQGLMKCGKKQQKKTPIYERGHSAELTPSKSYTNTAGTIRHTPEEIREQKKIREERDVCDVFSTWCGQRDHTSHSLRRERMEEN